MESKTEHMRRMRLRVKYWRVTPDSEPLFKLGKVDVVCNEQEPSDYDMDIPAVAAAARAMLAALELALPYVRETLESDIINDCEDESTARVDMVAVLEAIAQAKAAGIVEEGK